MGEYDCRTTIHLGQLNKKGMRNRASCVKVKLPHKTFRKETIFLMSKSITQDMAYRQSLMKYAEKYGVSRASRKYNKSRSYIYFWKQRWDGSVASLVPRTPLRTGLTPLDVSGSPDVSLTFLRVTYRGSQCRVPLSCAYAQSWRFPIVFCHLNL